MICFGFGPFSGTSGKTDGLLTLIHKVRSERTMVSEPTFTSIGNKTGDIDVQLDYKIIDLFSEGLYSSPNKAIEELVSNSFDAGARNVHVLIPSNLHAQDATITVIDDGEGMNQKGLRRHWLIGESNKRELRTLPLGRKQIGKFGIGKLSTYVLANRLTHISKIDAKYHSTSMNYHVIRDKHVERDGEPKTPISIPLYELTAKQAKQAVKQWAESAEFKTTKKSLFGKDSPDSWTITIMSDLKPKVHHIEPGRLEWILRTALPLRSDFNIWLNGKKLKPSKMDRDPRKRWILGKDMIDLPGLKDVTKMEDRNFSKSNMHRFGLYVPGLERVTGYAEIYEDLLTGGKSDTISRSHGFFVYVYERLLNAHDDHFGIPSNKLRHGTFSRFRLVIHMNGLDDGLRSTRESIGEGPMLETARNVLLSIFNNVRHEMVKYDLDEESGTKLAHKLAASPASLSRGPIVELSRAVVEGKKKARYLLVPTCTSDDARAEFLTDLEQRAQEADRFVTDVQVSFDGTSHNGLVKFDTVLGVLWLNGWHPFISTFDEEFTNKKLGQPLELFAMAEVLVESHLHSIGVKEWEIDEFLDTRDQLLRDLASESGRQSASSVANDLSNARNNKTRLEECVCDAFNILGFDARHIGGKKAPDGVAVANLPPDDTGKPRRYMVMLEAKSKENFDARVSEQGVNIGAVIRHRKKHDCDHAIIVGQAFQTSNGDDSALGQDIADDRQKTMAEGRPRTITLINIDDLVELVRLRPVKQFGLEKIRELFECRLPSESSNWVKSIGNMSVKKPQYHEIIKTIEVLQKKSKTAPVKYAALHNELTHLTPPIIYDTEDEVRKMCEWMALLVPNSIRVTEEKVELEQSAKNAMDDIMTAMQEYPSYA